MSNIDSKISVIISTYGRFSKLSQTIAFFLMQDYENKELFILNDGKEPIILEKDISSIHIINDTSESNLGNKLNNLAKFTSGKYISTWTDDDWYLPWFLSSAMKNITKKGWQPSPCWYCEYNSKKISLAYNNFEGSLVIEREAFNAQNKICYELIDIVSNKDIMSFTNMGKLSPYVFLWDDGGFHVSGNYNPPHIFKQNNIDFPNGRLLKPDFESANNRLNEFKEWTGYDK